MLDVRPFKPLEAGAAQWAQFHVFRRQRAEEDEPGEPVLSDADAEDGARRQWPLSENRRLWALVDGELVGSLGFGFRREGTPDYDEFAPFVRAWGGVLRPWRRRGIATALLQPLSAFLRDRGTTTLTLGAHLPDGHAFLAAIGAVEKQRTVENRLDLAGLDWDELARWQAAAKTSLRWEVHVGRVPLARLAALQAQFTELLGDLPMGALDHPPLRSELQGYVSWYEEMDRYGGEHILVLLLEGERVAGLCEAAWDARFPDRAYQTLTIVGRAWRGNGLGKALKAALLRLLRERRPDVRLMATTNAEANAAMLAINRRLGFAVHRSDASYQIGPEALENWLAARLGAASDQM